MSKIEVITLVDEIIQTLNERKVGYEKAAEQVKSTNPEFAERLQEYSGQSERFAMELMPYSDESSIYDVGTSPVSKIHRTWMDIKKAVIGSDEKRVIDDCLTGDEAAVKTYKGVLDVADLRTDLEIVLRNQYGKIREAIGQLKAYKEQLPQ